MTCLRRPAAGIRPLLAAAGLANAVAKKQSHMVGLGWSVRVE